MADDDPEALYAELVSRAKALPYYGTAWPAKKDARQQPVGLLAHRIETMPERAAAIGRHAAGAVPLADARLEALLQSWLGVKAATGTDVEKQLYAGMDVAALLQEHGGLKRVTPKLHGVRTVVDVAGDRRGRSHLDDLAEEHRRPPYAMQF